VVLLALVSVLSLGARVAWLGDPCHSPCRRSTDHLLIFDETYYVNAARVIAGIHPPPGAHYATAPLGDDPNSEHPQLAKLIMAGSIELFGDGPLAWRLGSLIAGSLAILGMWALARAAGAGEWPALGAAFLMAADNLLLVAGRIGTLDIYAVAAMVWAVAHYLRGRPWRAGAVIAIGIAAKEVSAYAILVLLVWELLHVWTKGESRQLVAAAARRFVAFSLIALGGFVALLAVMDRLAPPYNPLTHHVVAGGVLGHIAHIISYGAHLASPHGPSGIASYPWEWLVDYKPIVYLSIDPAHPAPGLTHDHPAALFLGMISPPILLLAVPGLVAAALAALRARRLALADALVASPSPTADVWQTGASAQVGLAWFLGTFAPYVIFSLVWQRTSYLYYMVIVMPGIYLAVSALVSRYRSHRRLVTVWVVAVSLAAVLMYPFTPLF